jgi:hypothetical protein
MYFKHQLANAEILSEEFRRTLADIGKLHTLAGFKRFQDAGVLQLQKTFPRHEADLTVSLRLLPGENLDQELEVTCRVDHDSVSEDFFALTARPLPKVGVVEWTLGMHVSAQATEPLKEMAARLKGLKSRSGMLQQLLGFLMSRPKRAKKAA